MNRALTLLIALSIVACASTKDKSPEEIQAYDDIVTLNDAIYYLSTPERIAEFMYRSFGKYQWGNRKNFLGTNRSFTGKEMLKRRKGDCKDYAAFAASILTERGIFCRKMQYIHTDTASTDKGWTGHFVAVYKDANGKYMYFSNERIKGPVERIEDIPFYELETEKGLQGCIMIAYKVYSPRSTSITMNREFNGDSPVILDRKLWDKYLANFKW